MECSFPWGATELKVYDLAPGPFLLSNEDNGFI